MILSSLPPTPHVTQSVTKHSISSTSSSIWFLVWKPQWWSSLTLSKETITTWQGFKHDLCKQNSTESEGEEWVSQKETTFPNNNFGRKRVLPHGVTDGNSASTVVPLSPYNSVPNSHCVLSPQPVTNACRCINTLASWPSVRTTLRGTCAFPRAPWWIKPSYPVWDETCTLSWLLPLPGPTFLLTYWFFLRMLLP